MTSLQVTRFITNEGTLKFEVSESSLPTESDLKDDQVLIKVLAAPINPSDIGPLFAPSYGGIGRFDGIETSKDSNGRVTTSLPIPKRTFKGMQGSKMIGRKNKVGNEGAGRVIAAGKGAKAQALKGKLVACMGMGGSYSQHAVVNVEQCMAHHDTTTPEEAASSFVNPLTALGMVKTMKAEGHTGIVHTAAASQLGQMLVKICLADNVPLVNIVRRPAQVTLLKSIGARWVVNSTSPTYEKDLVQALVESGATIAFDATGGGTLAMEIIKSMEAAANLKGGAKSNYGSTVQKKLYFYGGLNAGEPMLLRPFVMGGFSWTISGFLLGSGTAAITDADKQRVADEIKTTFATSYGSKLSLEDMLNPNAMKEYQAQKSNSKALVVPHMTSGSRM